jgi:DNA-binding CsgD family transcriptional regulator
MDDEDVRRLMDLLNELSRRAPQARRRRIQLLRGMCEIISADLESRALLGPTDEDRNLLRLVNEARGCLSMAPPVDSPRPSRALPPRLRDALKPLLEGASDKEIAEQLSVGVHTARQYVRALLTLFGAPSRTRLIAKLLGAAGSAPATHPHHPAPHPAKGAVTQGSIGRTTRGYRPAKGPHTKSPSPASCTWNDSSRSQK